MANLAEIRQHTKSKRLWTECEHLVFCDMRTVGQIYGFQSLYSCYGIQKSQTRFYALSHWEDQHLRGLRVDITVIHMVWPFEKATPAFWEILRHNAEKGIEVVKAGDFRDRQEYYRKQQEAYRQRSSREDADLCLQNHNRSGYRDLSLDDSSNRGRLLDLKT